MRKRNSIESGFLSPLQQWPIELLLAGSIAAISLIGAGFTLDSDSIQNLLLGGTIILLIVSQFASDRMERASILLVVAGAVIDIGSSLLAPENTFLVVPSVVAVLAAFSIRMTTFSELIPASAMVLLTLTGLHFAGKTTTVEPLIGFFATMTAVIAGAKTISICRTNILASRIVSLYLFGSALSFLMLSIDGRRIWSTTGIVLFALSIVLEAIDAASNHPVSDFPPHPEWISHLAAVFAFGTGTACLAAMTVTHPEIRWQSIGSIIPGLTGVGWLLQAWWREHDKTHALFHLANIERHTDPLTGLMNRRGLDKRLIEEIARAQRYRHALSILIIDLDDFKRINDQFGHLAGDDVLRDIAKTIDQQIRSIDIAGRFGGEEFLVILPETEKSGAGIVAERIRASVETQGDITTSIGLAELGHGATTAEELIGLADSALYAAKRAGKNRIRSSS